MPGNQSRFDQFAAPQRGAVPPGAMQPGSMQPGALSPGAVPPGAAPRFDEALSEPKPERKGRLIIGVLAGCAALLAIAFGGLLLIDKLVAGPDFKVGECLKQEGNTAVAADCSESGAFQVISSVSTQQECDRSQPTVLLDNKVLCLAPAGTAPGTGSSPGAETTPGAGDPTPGASTQPSAG